MPVPKMKGPLKAETEADDYVVAEEKQEDAPQILTLAFTGGYPGASQTELKAGDTFQIKGTTDKPCIGVEIMYYGACRKSKQKFAPATSFTVTAIIAARGGFTQSLPARARVKNAEGVYSKSFDTDVLGGTEDGVDLVKLNNRSPSFLDNGVIYLGEQTAFKLLEKGSQETVVVDADSMVYSSPNGDFSIRDPRVYSQVKPITCTNPGTCNDSEVNFRITANRAANDSNKTFDTIIKVADCPPVEPEQIDEDEEAGEL